MIFDSLRQGSTGTEEKCRRKNALSDFKTGEAELNNFESKKQKDFRRQKMELRRIRSLSSYRKSGDLIVFAEDNVSSKKRRSDVKKEIILINNAVAVDLPEEEVTSLSHGMVSVIGRRREMEDAVAAELGFLEKGGRRYSFFGVYDGHGGWRVAHACSEMLHKLLREIVEEDVGEEIAWERVMAAGFRKMDEEVNKNGAAVATTGSTAVVAVVGEGEVVVANCGDSRAVMSRGGVAVQLSDDHKPDRGDELERIEGCGGKVINWNGQRVLGVLATSRSIGDHYLKPFVVPDPEVKVMSRTKSDEFLVLASDGLWDVVSNDLACQVARRCLDGHINNPSVVAATTLAELAMARGVE